MHSTSSIRSVRSGACFVSTLLRCYSHSCCHSYGNCGWSDRVSAHLSEPFRFRQLERTLDSRRALAASTYRGDRCSGARLSLRTKSQDCEMALGERECYCCRLVARNVHAV